MSTETPQKQVPLSADFVKKLKHGEEIMQQNCDIHKANMETAKNVLLSTLNGNVVENDKHSLSGLLKPETVLTLAQVKLLESYCKEPTNLDVWSHKDTGGLAYDVETKQYANYGVSHKECFAQEDALTKFIVNEILPEFKKKVKTRHVRDLFLKARIEEYCAADDPQEAKEFGGYVVIVARPHQGPKPSSLKKILTDFNPMDESLYLNHEYLVLTTENFVSRVNKEPYENTDKAAKLPDNWDENFLETLCGIYTDPYSNSNTLPEAVEIVKTI